MSQANRTLAFLLCAVCSVGAAALTHMSFKPATPREGVDVGEEFYPEFKDPLKATSLRVAAYNEAAARVDTFAVEKKDGVWRIPSHHNYPADGKDRLAQTAASIIGITRGQLVSTSAEAHKRLGLLDPLDKSVTGTEGRGIRITISEGDNTLADYIIGKQEEGSGQMHYVRRWDEERAYLASVQPNISTKFVDWIQPNLLDATATNFRELIIDRYKIDEERGAVVPGEQSHLTRESSTDEWTLEELKDPEKKVKTSVVNTMTSTLANMKIVGVRPKPAGLGAQLKGEDGVKSGIADQLDMQDKGFFLERSGRLLSNEGDFLAGTSDGVFYVLRFGEVFTGSDMEIEIGSSKSEGDKKEGEKDAKADEKAAEGEDGKAKEDDDPAKPDDEKKENRYVFITAQFDESLLGPVPVEPVKPTPPPGYAPTTGTAPSADKATPADGEKAEAPKTEETPAASETPATEGETPAAESSSDKSTSFLDADGVLSLAGPPSDPLPVTEEAAEDSTEIPATPSGAEATQAEAPPATDEATTAPAETPATPTEEPTAPPEGTTPPADTAAPAATDAAEQPAGDAAPGGEVTPANQTPKDPNKEYEEALKKYEQAMDEYKVQKAEYEERKKKGEERVKELSARFADWYYVISADVFEDLNVKPEELVEPKTAAAPGAGAGAGLPPGFDPSMLLNPAGEAPATPPTTPESPASEAETSPGNEPAAEDTTTSETPAGETPTAEKPEETAPPATPEPPATETAPEGGAAAGAEETPSQPATEAPAN